MDLSDTIWSLKQKVEEWMGMAGNRQRLKFCIRELEDLHTLVDYRIQKESTLYPHARWQSCPTRPVFVKWNNKTFQVYVSDCPKAAKKAIEKTVGIPVAEQRLFFAGRKIDDSPLTDYLGEDRAYNFSYLEKVPRLDLKMIDCVCRECVPPRVTYGPCIDLNMRLK